MARKPLLPTEQPPQELPESEPREQQKDDFVSVVSHELRTPLTIIQEVLNDPRQTLNMVGNGGQAPALFSVYASQDPVPQLGDPLLDNR